MPKIFGNYKIPGSILTVILIIVSFHNHSATQASSRPQGIILDRPRYVFLFIGDGMGVAQREVVDQYLQVWSGELGQLNRRDTLLMDQFPVAGFTSTENIEILTTDSGAAGTAMATGHKTANQVISMSANHSTSYPTIAEIAQEHGWNVGIVTSTSLNQATPAAFYAHTESRENLNTIWRQLVTSQFDYFAGGGIDASSGIMEFIRSAEANGYSVTRTLEDFWNISPSTGKVIAINPVLDDHSELPYVVEDHGDSLSLADFTSKGIEVLMNETGFFLMVEGGRIDMACHENQSERMVGEVLAFDEAILEAFEFYLLHPTDTLIVVTGDHETGGLQWIQPQTVTDSSLPAVFQGLSGRNPIRIRNESGHGYSADEAGEVRITSDLAETVILPDYPGSIASVSISEINLTWTTRMHTDTEVLTTAVGAGAESFSGTYENTEIFWKLLEMTGLSQ